MFRSSAIMQSSFNVPEEDVPSTQHRVDHSFTCAFQDAQTHLDVIGQSSEKFSVGRRGKKDIQKYAKKIRGKDISGLDNLD